MRTNDLIKIAFFPALMGATTWISIPMVGAPITLQTLFVLLAGFILGSKKGFISMLVYLLVGLVGVPVFSGFSSGLGALFGPTGGFLLTFPFAAYCVGYVKEHFNNDYVAGLVGSLLIYVVGVPWLAWQLDFTVTAAASIMLVYVPGDILKLIIAILISKRVNAGI